MRKETLSILLLLFAISWSGLYGQEVLFGDLETRTLTADVEYLVESHATVPDGVILTIEPGTVIKFTPGVEAYFEVQRGGYIDAAGTEENPIVFTSAAENPQPGDWRAPMFFGKGPGHNPTWEVELDHNLGILTYIRMEYTFWSFGLYNVGSGTTVNNISTYSGGGIYVFGGNVSLHHLAAHLSTHSGVFFRGGYVGDVDEVFINGSYSNGLNLSNTGSDSEYNGNIIPGNSDPDLEPRTNPSITNVTLCNNLRSLIYLRNGAIGTFYNILLYNGAYRWNPAIMCRDEYLLDQITLDNLQLWNIWEGFFDWNTEQIVDPDYVFDQDPMFEGLVPTDPIGVGAMVAGDWLSSWGHSVDVNEIAFAVFDHVEGFQWGGYMGDWLPITVPGGMLTLRAWYFVDMTYSAYSADLKIGFDSDAYQVLDVYIDEDYILPGEASVEYSVDLDTITVSFASNSSYAGRVYLFNVDLLVGDAVGPITTYPETFNATVNEDSWMHFLYDRWTIFIPENIFGDVSMNGEITSMDASLILQELVGNTWLIDAQRYFGDVSGEEDLTAYDASLIQQYMVGLITEFPVESGAGAAPASGVMSMLDGELSGPGETVEVPLFLDGGDNILSFEADISFNPEHLVFEEAQWSELLSDFIIDSNIDYESGTLRFAGAGALPDGEAGVFTTLIFTVNPSMTETETEVIVSRLRWNEEDLQYDIASSMIVGIDEYPSNPIDYTLIQNYPNPFNPETTIKYGLPENSEVTLTIYDITGRNINTIVNTTQPAGWYQVNWDGTENNGLHVKSGMYFGRLQVGNDVRTIKMINLK